jgi:hypothetical protein
LRAGKISLARNLFYSAILVDTLTGIGVRNLSVAKVSRKVDTFATMKKEGAGEATFLMRIL